jgi:endonuclease YncB( thermonuclease family)
MGLTKICAVAIAMALTACGGQGSANTDCGAGLAAHTLSGTAVNVHDGDTFTLHHSNDSDQIRLQGIDAPELAQAWGSESHQALQSLALQQALSVHYDQRDRYGRVLGHVFNAGCEHLNLRLLREGMAWYYRAYACDLPAHLRTAFDQAEQSARQQRLGLWQQPQPMAPWVFRNGEDPPVPVCSN